MRLAMRGKLVAGLLVLGVFQLVPATGRAQYGLERPAARPFSGQVTLINQINCCNRRGQRRVIQ